MTLAEIEAYVNTNIAENKGLDDRNKELVDKKEKRNHSIISGSQEFRAKEDS